jgi:hypothetical protein
MNENEHDAKKRGMNNVDYCAWLRTLEPVKTVGKINNSSTLLGVEIKTSKPNELEANRKYIELVAAIRNFFVRLQKEALIQIFEETGRTVFYFNINDAKEVADILRWANLNLAEVAGNVEELGDTRPRGVYSNSLFAIQSSSSFDRGVPISISLKDDNEIENNAIRASVGLPPLKKNG